LFKTIGDKISPAIGLIVTNVGGALATTLANNILSKEARDAFAEQFLFLLRKTFEFMMQVIRGNLNDTFSMSESLLIMGKLSLAFADVRKAVLGFIASLLTFPTRFVRDEGLNFLASKAARANLDTLAPRVDISARNVKANQAMVDAANQQFTAAKAIFTDPRRARPGVGQMSPIELQELISGKASPLPGPNKTAFDDLMRSHAALVEHTAALERETTVLRTHTAAADRSKAVLEKIAEGRAERITAIKQGVITGAGAVGGAAGGILGQASAERITTDGFAKDWSETSKLILQASAALIGAMLGQVLVATGATFLTWLGPIIAGAVATLLAPVWAAVAPVALALAGEVAILASLILLFANFGPQIKKGLEVGFGFVGGLVADAFRTVISIFSTSFSGITSAIAFVNKKMWDLFNWLTFGFFDEFGKKLGALLIGIGDYIADLWNKYIIKPLSDMFGAFGVKFKQAWDWVFDGLISWSKDFIEGLKEKVGLGSKKPEVPVGVSVTTPGPLGLADNYGIVPRVLEMPQREGTENLRSIAETNKFMAQTPAVLQKGDLDKLIAEARLTPLQVTDVLLTVLQKMEGGYIGKVVGDAVPPGTVTKAQMNTPPGEFMNLSKSIYGGHPQEGLTYVLGKAGPGQLHTDNEKLAGDKTTAAGIFQIVNKTFQDTALREKVMTARYYDQAKYAGQLSRPGMSIEDFLGDPAEITRVKALVDSLDPSFKRLSKELSESFLPLNQVEITLELLRANGSIALAQTGKFEDALEKSKATWTSLPGGIQEQTKKVYQAFVDAIGRAKTAAGGTLMQSVGPNNAALLASRYAPTSVPLIAGVEGQKRFSTEDTFASTYGSKSIDIRTPASSSMLAPVSNWFKSGLAYPGTKESEQRNAAINQALQDRQVEVAKLAAASDERMLKVAELAAKQASPGYRVDRADSAGLAGIFSDELNKLKPVSEGQTPYAITGERVQYWLDHNLDAVKRLSSEVKSLEDTQEALRQAPQSDALIAQVKQQGDALAQNIMSTLKVSDKSQVSVSAPKLTGSSEVVSLQTAVQNDLITGVINGFKTGHFKDSIVSATTDAAIKICDFIVTSFMKTFLKSFMESFLNEMTGIEVMASKAGTAFKEFLTGTPEGKVDTKKLNIGGVPETDASGKVVQEIVPATKGIFGKIGDLVADGTKSIYKSFESLFSGDNSIVSMITTFGKDFMKTISSIFDTKGDNSIGKSISDWIGPIFNDIMMFFGGAPTGGVRKGMAEGGPVRGLGSGTSDSIPILASNNEYMVRASRALMFRPLLDAINYGDGRLKFASGGAIGYGNAAMNSAVAGRDKDMGLVSSNKTLAQTFNISVTGDISRQTRNEIARMPREIASMVNKQNVDWNKR
jgi:muramidase (phage lysozyme)